MKNHGSFKREWEWGLLVRGLVIDCHEGGHPDLLVHLGQIKATSFKLLFKLDIAETVKWLIWL